MGIYLLLACICILLVISYYISNQDIMSPAVLLTGGYLLACMCCMYNIEYWGVKLHFVTYTLIAIGIAAFIAGTFAQSLMFRRRMLKAADMMPLREIKVSGWVMCFFVLYDIFVLVLTFMEIFAMAGGLQATLGSMIGVYRHAYSYTDFRANVLNVQLLKISKGAAYTFLFIFFNNIFCRERAVKKNIKYLIPVIVYMLITMIKGGRISAIMVIISGLFLMYYFWHRRIGWNRNVSFRFIKRIFYAFLLFVVLFFGSRELVGRRETTPVMEYLTTYLGGSFQLLDQYLSEPETQMAGMETFPGIIQSLQKLGLREDSIHKSLEFRRSPTGVYLGNVYTGLRRYYHDFGLFGMIMLQFIYGFLFNTLYWSIRKMHYLNSTRLFMLTTYSSLLFCIITQAIEDHFWIDLSVGFVVELIVVWIVTTFIMDFRTTRGFRLIYRKWRG